jgi:hypothetical protein
MLYMVVFILSTILDCYTSFLLCKYLLFVYIIAIILYLKYKYPSQLRTAYIYILKFMPLICAITFAIFCFIIITLDFFGPHFIIISISDCTTRELLDYTTTGSKRPLFITHSANEQTMSLLVGNIDENLKNAVIEAGTGGNNGPERPPVIGLRASLDYIIGRSFPRFTALTDPNFQFYNVTLQPYDPRPIMPRSNP